MRLEGPCPCPMTYASPMAIDHPLRAHGGIVRRTASSITKEMLLPRQVIRVEPLSTYMEAWKAPVSMVTRHGDAIYVSGCPPFDPETGKVAEVSIERQAEIVMDQLKLCVETAGSSMDNILKCNVYCTNVASFPIINDVYARYFDGLPPARIFVTVPTWPGQFDLEIDCIAAVV
jgi:2-iminobutanoate/2-iminopropanoate deaminase